MLIVLSLAIFLIVTGAMYLYGEHVQVVQKLHTRAFFFRQIAARMREHAASMEKEERRTLGEPGHHARIRQDKIEERFENLITFEQAK